jgi:hypothetical protein
LSQPACPSEVNKYTKIIPYSLQPALCTWRYGKIEALNYRTILLVFYITGIRYLQAAESQIMTTAWEHYRY